MKILGERFVLGNGEPRKGGMAVVHRAADGKNGLQPVAVKFMTAGSRILDDRVLAEAFSRELTALEAIEHPNVVKIIEFDPRHDPPYLVLEWLERDLLGYLEGTVIADWNDFYSRIGRPVLEALSHALTKNIVHRDIKPGNVLVDDHGNPKVADFGISKFQTYAPGGMTLAAYKSEPYAPFDDGIGYATRDPYSFAVLALRCFASSEFSTHADVVAALSAFTGPPPVAEILRKALDPDPSARFPSVVELQAALDNAQVDAGANEKASRVCYVTLYAGALAQLGRQLGEDREQRIRRVLEQDMAESCSFFSWHDKVSDKKLAGQFLARTPQFGLWICVSDKGGDHLIVRKAWLAESEGHAAHAEYGFQAPVVFRFDRPPLTYDGVPTIRWLVDVVNQHELDDSEARRSRKEEGLLREWANTLRFRQYLGDSRFAPIPYDAIRVEGNRVHFRVPSMPDGVLLEQARLIRSEQRIILSGIVDDIASDHIALWVENGVSELPPDSGFLLIDDLANRVAIDRQKTALDAVRYGRCLRPALRDIILNPSTSRPSVPIRCTAWVHKDLDEGKRDAVAKALGSEDVLVVQGPPGTGKTVFITELVAQLLDRDPECKILLTSPTHVALDNVLERLHSLRPEARLLRVARSDNGRVSRRVLELTVDRVANRWRSEVVKASEKFLSLKATALGVRREDITLGIAAGRLRAESTELEHIQTRLQECGDAIAVAKQRLAEAQVSKVADAYDEISEALDEFHEQERGLGELKKTVGARQREAARALAATGVLGTQLAGAGVAELAEWEQGLLAGSESDRRFHGLIQIAEQWQLRFARSREFYAAMVADSSVVAGTCLGFASVPGMLAAEFDVCIVDEASKATATELLVPLSRARRWVLVGDPKQLPPFVEDLLDYPKLLKDYELDRDSFQTTLLDRFIAGLSVSNIAHLHTQHRMIRPIGDLISTCFYDKELKSVRDDRDPRLRLVMPSPVMWLTTARLPHRNETYYRGAFKNIAEARVIGQWLRRLDFVAKAAGVTYEVGVIAGYVGQCTELGRVVASIQHETTSLSIECNTVDAFQGREVDVCVYSVTRCNERGVIGFLRDARRLNVALSRGRLGLVIVGDHVFCRSAVAPNPLRSVVEYIEAHPDDCSVTEVTP